MIRTTDDAGNPYPMLEFPVTEFVRLRAAIADRAPDLRVRLTRAYGDSGPHVMEVMAPGAAPGAPWDLTAYITCSQQAGNGWYIHCPDQGAQMTFNTCLQVAKFLSAVPRFTPGWHEIWDRWMAAHGALFTSEYRDWSTPMTWADLDQLKAAFAVHASHLTLAFTGSSDINVIPANRPESPPLAIIRSNEDPNAPPRPPGSPGIWRAHTIRTGTFFCEGTAEGVAQYMARPEAALHFQG